jgi:multidrug efflux pump subunit AcrB
MTLGGLALAVGILVDDATVAVENTHRNIGLRKPLVRAVIDGAAQIAIPTFVSTLAICIVFVPVLLLTGTAKFLFTPLAMAVVFAMLASYLLSRTLVPTMARFLLKSEVEMYQLGIDGEAKHGRGPFWRLHYWFDGLFERLRFRYVGLLDWSLRRRGRVLTAFIVFSLASVGLVWLIGKDFFPNVDSGQMRLEARAPAGTRLEQTEVRFAAIEREIRHVIPAGEMDTLIDNIGVVNCWACLAQGEVPTISPADGEILISLKKDHGSTRDYEVRLRKHLRERFPDTTFFFNPANIITQILNFGLPAPIDLQVVGRDADAN